MPEITYTGHTAVPSDYECADGQLALSLNLINENGSLQPLFSPSIIFTLPTDYKVAYIHKTTDFTHYIITRKDNQVNVEEKEESGKTTTNPSIYYIDEKNAVGDKSDINDPDYVPLGDIDGTEITAIQAVGNTLIIVTKTAMNYYLWKTDEDNHSYYAYLGTHLPELNLSFGLQGEIVSDVDDLDEDTAKDQKITDEGYTAYYGFEIDLTEPISDCDWDDFKETGKYKIDDDNKTIINERVFAEVNKFIVNHSTNAGKFLFPFFVRYAFRLYDGSLTMHSAPILMLANTVCSPIVFIQGYNIHGHKSSAISEWDKDVDTLYCTVKGVAHNLDFAATNTQEELNSIADTWSDIIKSVDIFISAPLYNYDEAGEVQYLQYAPYTDLYDDTNGYCLCRPSIAKERYYNTWTSHIEESTAYKWEAEETKIVTIGNEEVEKEYYCLNHYCHCTFSFLIETTDGLPAFRVLLPVKSKETIAEDVKDCCNFYLLKSIKTKDITTDVTIVDIEEDYLQSLVNREQMTDDYDSHDTLLPTFTYNYNSRLVMANITKILYSGYDPQAMYCYVNGGITADSTALTLSSDRSYINAAIYTYIKEDNKVIITRSPISHLDLVWKRTSAGEETLLADHIYFFYPNTNAYKALLVRYGDETTPATVIQEMALETHDFLNGVVYFDNWAEPPVISSEEGDIPQATTDQTVLVANKIYNSEINNPFFFPVENIATVGTGTILGIATAAKALSQGQFGSFPLYAFCDDGVWALSVSSEGVYSAVQPITRDKCINPAAITQLDTSVLFPTDRGIMQISGSDTACFTDILNGQNTFDITTLPAYDQLLTLAGHDEITIRPIYELLEKCIIIYDYTNQHIYVCDDEEKMAYVISSKSNAWGMAAVDIQSTVNSYPEAYAMSGDNFVDFSHPDKTNPQNCFLITRPLKLEDPNAFKTVTAVIQRGYFNKEHIQTALYGSRDLMHWHLVRSSTSYEIRAFAGTPYKYFRIATLAQLQKDEAIFGATVNAIKRFTNKER